MGKKIEGWLFNVFAGKIVARAVVTLLAWLASGPVQSVLGGAGIDLKIDQAELTAALIAGSQVAFEWVKKRRQANPNSPAVQTDAKAPGGNISAAEVAAGVPPK